MNIKSTSLLIVCLCLGYIAFAQAISIQDSLAFDVIYLKDGNVIKGDIIRYIPDKEVKVKILNRKVLYFESVHIDSVYISPVKKDVQEELTFTSKEHTHTAYLSLLNGTTPWNNGEQVMGFGINYTLGQRISHRFAAGIGTGLDYYYIHQREVLVPFYLEAQYDFRQRNTIQNFIKLSSGYGFGLNSGRVKAGNGGWMIHPSIGINFASTQDYTWLIDAGVRFQRATFNFNDFNTIRTHKMLYKRLAIRIGLKF